MHQIGDRPGFGRTLVRLDGRCRTRAAASAAMQRQASAHRPLGGDTTTDELTLVQHVARWTLTVVAIAFASALYALELHATLH